MNSISIRKASVTDLPAILSMYNQPDFDNGGILDLPSAEKIFGRIQQYPDYNLYVAIRDDETAGSFALLIMDNLGHLGARSGIVEDVVVKTELQNRGIGRQMMRFAMEECRKAGCYKLTLSSNMKREKAHLFYESLGFEKHGYSYMTLF